MMSDRSRDDFDRLMTGWMEAEARVREPEDLVDRVLDRTRAARRRPRWLVADWWPFMQNISRLQTVWRPAPIILAVVALLIALALAAALLAGAQRHVPPPFGPAANGSIVYDTKGTIKVVNQTGSGARTLVGSVPNASGPEFSPDGTQVAFWGDNAPDALYVANADGQNVRRLVAGLWITTDRPPDWSPDGRRVVVSTESGPDAEDEHLLIVDVATAATITIDRAVAGNARLFVPSWSPDSQLVAFVAMNRVTQIGRLWVVHADGSNAHELATGDLTPTAVRPRWAPSGSKHVLAYDTVRSGRAAAATFDLDSGIEELVAGPASEDGVWPSWSPDGTRLAWLGGQKPEAIVLAPVDGRSSAAVVANPGITGPIAWSPDGTRVFGTTADSLDIVVVTLDGSTPPIRVPLSSAGSLPDWQRLAR